MAPADAFPLKRPPSARRKGPQALAILLLAALLMLTLSDAFAGWWLRWPALGPTLVAALLWRRLARWQRRDVPGAPYAVALTEAGLCLPQRPGDPQPEILPWAAIDGLMHWGGARGTVIIETPQRTHRLEGAALADPESLPRLVASLRLAIARQPTGVAQIRRIHQRRLATKALFKSTPLLTYGLLIALVAVYVVEDALGALDQPSRLVMLGANQPALSLSSDPWRLVSATFLHAHWLHLALNAVGLLALGRILEHLLGRQGVWAIFLWSALGGSLASALADQAPLSVGVSTALAGMMGALWVLQRRHPEAMPTGIRLPPGTWVFLLAVNLALPVLIPIIDLAGHLGGFVAGAALTWALTWRRPTLSAPLQRGPTAILAFAGAVICLGGLGGAGQALTARPGAQMAQAAGAFAARLSDPDLSPSARYTQAVSVNDLAYRAATEVPGVTRPSLEAALGGMIEVRRALEGLAGEGLLPHETLRGLLGEFEDTRGAILARLGRLDEALAVQLEALALVRRSSLAQHGLVATQLARFALALAPPSADRPPLALDPERPTLLTSPGSDLRVGVVMGADGPLGLLASHGDGRLSQIAGPPLASAEAAPATIAWLPAQRLAALTPAERRALMTPGHWGWWPLDPRSPQITPLAQ